MLVRHTDVHRELNMSTKFICLAMLTVSTTVAFAGGADGPFTEKKGVLEFTGTMIVRPLQREALVQKGYDSATIDRVRTRAFGRLHAGQVRRDFELDYVVIKVPKGSDESKESQRLMKTGDYEYAVPNYRAYPVGAKTTPNDPRFGQQWHHKVMRSEEAWTLWKGPNTITCAIVDTGVMTAHEDLKAGVVKGYNSITRTREVDGGTVVDEHGHGTHCAGDAAAQGNNGKGLVGAGWNLRIMPIKAAGPSGGASFDDLAEGAKWAASNGAKVVSVSFSGVDVPLVGTTGTYCKSKGALLLWAAGNDGRNLSGFSYKDTIVVGASEEQDKPAGFSAYGKGVSVFAPGQNIWSTTNDGGYQPFTGTSMATPVTNGVCAMIWSINPKLTPNQVQNILYSTCDQIASPSIVGHGRVNLYKAVVAAIATKTVDTIFKPMAVSTIIGTYKSGSLANVANGTGTGYKVSSVFDPKTGFSTVVGLSYKVSQKVGQLDYIEPNFTVSLSPGVYNLGMVYLWDNFTQKYVLLNSAALPKHGGQVKVSGRQTGGLAPFVAADGTIKVAVRIFSPIGRRGEPGGSFTSTVHKADALIGIKP